MSSVDSAAKLVDHYGQNPCYIRTKPIYFQFSTRTEIKIGNNAGDGKASGQVPGRILLVSIIDCHVEVTLENIYSVFKPYGDVLKIVIFLKEGMFKSLVEMRTIEQAVSAKMYLEGKDMFANCCTLRIGFSNLPEVTVKQNGPKSRDFTIPEEFGGQYLNSGPLIGGPQYGDYSFQAPQQFGQSVQNYSNSMSMTGGPQIPGPTSPYPLDSAGQDAKGCVLLVSNLTPEHTNCDSIFTLFGVYGDVLRVKILFNKRDTAMVQFATPQQAHLAQVHLNHLFLHTKELAINISKHGEVALSRESDPLSVNLTKDYTNSPIHRFRNRETRATKNIHPPSQVLHVSNLPDIAHDDELRKMFGEEQGTEPLVQFFLNSKNMAYVKMASVHDAVLALIRLHNFRFGDKYIRVSFSGKDPNQMH